MALSCASSTKDEFQGKSVLLTGATGGLGKALAQELVGCGAKLLVLSGRSDDALKSLKAELETNSKDTTIRTVVCDLADENQVAKLASSAMDLSNDGFDVLINNGGVSSRSRFLDSLPEVDKKVMQINFLAGAVLCKAVTPKMVSKRSGRIIWISSVQGLLGIPNRSSYAASKFAVQGYCESIRAELASSGVSVHTISPGYIRTNLSRSAITGDGGKYGKMDETTESGADPRDVAVQTLDACAKGEAELVVAAGTSAIAAIWMRLLCPKILQNLLVKRYEKSQIKEKQN